MLLCAASGSDALAQQSGRVQTTSQVNSSSVEDAAKAPLRDLNVIRTDIPQVLIDSLGDPYARPKTKKCQELISILVPLDDALGRDIDQPPPEDKRGLTDRGRPMALGAAAGVASDLIPFHSALRYLTGAQQHDDYVQQAILAGSVRRAYIKGLGEARGCPFPATPSHALAGRVVDPPPPPEGMRPRYPIH